jgi:hypothetical protein
MRGASIRGDLQLLQSGLLVGFELPWCTRVERIASDVGEYRQRALLAAAVPGCAKCSRQTPIAGGFPRGHETCC